jgi:hypothetical protein
MDEFNIQFYLIPFHRKIKGANQLFSLIYLSLCLRGG